MSHVARQRLSRSALAVTSQELEDERASDLARRTPFAPRGMEGPALLRHRAGEQGSSDVSESDAEAAGAKGAIVFWLVVGLLTVLLGLAIKALA